MRRLFRQFSFPGGIPSHVAPETPGSIHEGGELGLRAGPRLRRGVRQPRPARVPASSATARPRPARWRRAGTPTSSSNPARDGAVLPILHLNGYKIANPTVLARIPRRRAARAAAAATATSRTSSSGDDPATDAPADGRRRSTRWSTRSRAIQRARARAATTARPRWPMIVLRTPKGWTGPKEVDGLPVEGTFRAHQVPLGGARREPRAPRAARGRGCARYRPEELFDDERTARVAELAALAPERRAAHGRQPARQRRAAAARPVAARLPRLRRRRSTRPARRRQRGHPRARRLPARRHARQRREANFRVFGPDETASNRLDAVFEVTDRAWMAERRDGDDHLAPDGRVMEVLSRAPVPGLAGGLPAHRPPRPVQLLRGVHPHRRLDVQPAREVAEGHARHPVAAADRVAELPAHLARLAPGPQRLLPPGPGLHRPRGEQEGRGRPRLPAAGRQHAAVGRRTTACAAATTSTSIVAGKQPALDWLPMDEPILHCTRGHRHLGLGQQRRRRRARRRAGLRRRRARRSRRWPPRRCCASTCRSSRCASSTSST